MPEPRIFTTDEWGARPPSGTGFSKHPAEGIVIHHTADPNRPPEAQDREKEAAFKLARRIQDFHMDDASRAWLDTGQHFTISRGGIILEGRHASLAAAKAGMVVRGAHASSVDRYNESWFGIELEGINTDGFHLTDDQWESLIELCAWLSVWGGFDPANIIGHKEILAGHTECPGTVVDRLDELRREVKVRKARILNESEAV